MEVKDILKNYIRKKANIGSGKSQTFGQMYWISQTCERALMEGAISWSWALLKLYGFMITLGYYCQNIE